MKVKPFNNQVIIIWKDESREELEEKVAKAGLVLPDSAQEETKIVEMGEVIAVAENIVDRNNEKMDLKEGDKVLFATFHPFEMKVDGKDAYALPASDIIAKIND